jgi:hypothetical protein
MINRVANPTNRVRKRFISDCHVDRVHRSSVTSPGISHGLKTTLSSRPASSPTFGKRLCYRSQVRPSTSPIFSRTPSLLSGPHVITMS